MIRTRATASTIAERRSLAARRACAVCLVASLALASSCAARNVVAFSWVGPSGESLVFSSSSARKDAMDGLFGRANGSDGPISYALREGILAPPGRDFAVDVELVAGQARATIGVSGGKDGKGALAQASFPILGRRVRLYLKLPIGSPITSVHVSSQGTGSFKIVGLSFQEAFSGIERVGDMVWVSSNFRMAVGRNREISISDPVFGIGGRSRARDSGLIVSYGPATSADALDDTMTIVITDGKVREELALSMGPRGESTLIGDEFLREGVDLIEARSPSGREITSFCVRPIQSLDYELSDLGRVLASGTPPDGKDYSLYRWDALPDVLILLFKDYATQDRYLKRLAFFVEKAGYRGKLHPDSVISGLHGWNAHDYRCEDLAAFFRKANDEKFPLNAEERDLERLLADRGLIRGTGTGTEAGAGALISISAETPIALRRTLLVHESTHAIFFVDEEYRQFVLDAWARIGEGEKWFWTSYLGWAAYDTTNSYLMANEFQAYLLQQPLSAVADYFTRRKAEELIASRPHERSKVEAYMAKYGESFETRARVLDDWLSKHYGFSAGRTYRLRYSR